MNSIINLSSETFTFTKCNRNVFCSVNHDEINEMEIALNTSAIETELYLGKHPTCSDGYRIPPEDPEDSDCFADASIGYDSQKLGKFVLSGNKRAKCQREVTVSKKKIWEPICKP